MRHIASILLMMILSGCVLAPKGTDDERARLAAAGKPYARPVESRALPELPDHPSWRDVLHRAFLANGELEAAYFEWQAAVARINQAAAYPNSNVAVGFDYMFSG